MTVPSASASASASAVTPTTPPPKVGIVGLGLIGGSLGLDLQAADWTVLGVVQNETTACRARESCLASRVDTDLAGLAECDLVLLALPLDRLLNPPAALVEALPPEAVVADVGSVKAPVLAVWETLHPRFVGAHPMAGTAAAGVEAGQRHLFRGRPWVLTPTPRTDPDAMVLVQHLAERVEAQVVKTDAAAHDSAAALISHLPILVSAALLLAIEDEPDAEVASLARELASSGFADTTRVGGGNAALGMLVTRTNRLGVLKGLRRYRARLQELELAVSAGRWTELQTALEKAGERRTSFRSCC